MSGMIHAFVYKALFTELEEKVPLGRSESRWGIKLR
jgi:hypothetical protein